MEIEIREGEKRVYVWLTRAESGDAGLREALKPLFREYKAKKYLVAAFLSGSEDLRELTRELLCYNRVRLREREAEKESKAGEAS